MKMGVTIKCKKTGRNIDLGCSGFMRLRRKVAELMGGPFCSHYKKLYDAPPLMRPDEEKKFYTEWDTEAIRIVRENDLPVKVVNFLLESDCDGKIRYGACGVSIVEQWAKEHPVKTRQSEFLKQYPEAEIGDDGLPGVDPCQLYKEIANVEIYDGYCNKYGCTDCRRDFWLAEISEGKACE